MKTYGKNMKKIHTCTGWWKTEIKWESNIRSFFFSRGEAEYLPTKNLQMDDDWLSRNGILRQDCTHMRLYAEDFTHDHSTFRRGFADFCKLLFKDEERHLGQHDPQIT